MTNADGEIKVGKGLAVYMYIQIYVCIYICIYIHLQTHTQRRGWRGKREQRPFSVHVYTNLCI